MSWCDEVLGFCDASGGAVDPSPTYEAADARIDALSMTDWVRAWCEVCTAGLKDQMPGVYAFRMYFERLSHDAPERGIPEVAVRIEQACVGGRP